MAPKEQDTGKGRERGGKAAFRSDTHPTGRPHPGGRGDRAPPKDRTKGPKCAVQTPLHHLSPVVESRKRTLEGKEGGKSSSTFLTFLSQVLRLHRAASSIPNSLQDRKKTWAQGGRICSWPPKWEKDSQQGSKLDQTVRREGYLLMSLL